MGLYLFCLCFGFAGLLVMAVLGHTHILSHHGTNHGHAHHVSHGTHSHALDHDGLTSKWTGLTWLSPRILFSLLFGFGASGYLLQNILPAFAVLLLALALAYVFERWLIQPL